MYLQQFLIIKLYYRVTKRKWESDMAYVVKLTETPVWSQSSDYFSFYGDTTLLLVRKKAMYNFLRKTSFVEVVCFLVKRSLPQSLWQSKHSAGNILGCEISVLVHSDYLCLVLCPNIYKMAGTLYSPNSTLVITLDSCILHTPPQWKFCTDSLDVNFGMDGLSPPFHLLKMKTSHGELGLKISVERFTSNISPCSYYCKGMLNPGTGVPCFFYSVTKCSFRTHNRNGVYRP